MENKSECPYPSGVLVIIGGKESKGDQDAPNRNTPAGFVKSVILQAFAELSGKKYANIQVVTSGSEEGDTMFEEYKKVFNELGHTAVGHIHHDIRQEVLEDDSHLQKMMDADAIFFAGGDQLKLTSIYGGTPFLTKLRMRYISDNIIIGGNQRRRNGAFDTHFVHRGRFVRLAQVIATNPGCTGIGIEEDTAVILRNGLDAEVLGSGTVILILGLYITESDMDNFTEKKPVSVRNLRVDI